MVRVLVDGTVRVETVRARLVAVDQFVPARWNDTQQHASHHQAPCTNSCVHEQD
jgi:hypothetical protein